MAQRFAVDDIFYAIRLEPYLVATARHYEGLGQPDVAKALHGLAAVTGEGLGDLRHQRHGLPVSALGDAGRQLDVRVGHFKVNIAPAQG